MVFRACNRCGREAFKTYCAFYLCDNCYRQKIPQHVQEEELQELQQQSSEPYSNRVTIGPVSQEYRALYCAECDNLGFIQISLDDKVLALACSERCLRDYLQECRSKLPLSLEQCNRYELRK